MAAERVQRRLAAILAADVVGYSALMGADEAGTLAALKQLRAELFDPAIAEHRGRIVKLMGDGALVEFASVVDAVECAVGLQRVIADKNASASKKKTITFRIGINLGDVIIEDDDIYGDGVNVAARLEALAEPGGICISGPVYDQVNNKLDLEFSDLGPQEVKNIAEPVRTYRVHVDTDGSLRAAQQQPVRRSFGAVAGAAVLAAVAAVSLYLWMNRTQPARDTVATAANSATVGDAKPVTKPRPDLPSGPSIAVLAFQNMSTDPNQEYFADGIAEDIITDLSKLSAIFVVARNSSFQYKGKDVDLRQVGRELGVKFVLEGSVRRSGDQVRITAQLIDASTGGHLWAERYDGGLSDVFALQDKVSGRIIEALKLQLTPSERRAVAEHGTDDPQAYDAYLQGLSLLAKRHRLDVDNYRAAQLSFEKAIRIDPDYAQALAGLAWAKWYFDQASTVGTVEEAFKLAERSISINDNALARRLLASKHFSLHGNWHPTTRKMDEAIAELERARQLQPNDPDVLADLAAALSFNGRPEEALILVEKAMALNPSHPKWYFAASGIALLLTGDPGRAVRHLRTWSSSNPRWAVPYIFLAAALANSGDISAAKVALARNNKLWGYEIMLPAARSTWPMSPDQEKIFTKGLRLAGMRESPY